PYTSPRSTTCRMGGPSEQVNGGAISSEWQTLTVYAAPPEGTGPTFSLSNGRSGTSPPSACAWITECTSPQDRTIPRASTLSIACCANGPTAPPNHGLWPSNSQRCSGYAGR